MIKQAIIPLAGLGTRMLPLTSVTPKELLPINGKPNLEYILEECLEDRLESDCYEYEYYQRFTKELIEYDYKEMN